MLRKLPMLAAAALLVACAGEEPAATTAAGPDTTAVVDAPATTAAPTTAAPTTAAPATAAPTTEAGPAARITIAGTAFSGSVTVSVGDTVQVTNTDALPHTWTSTDAVWDSGTLGQGDTFSFTFDEAGEFPFVCTIHPSMTGTVTVEG